MENESNILPFNPLKKFGFEMPPPVMSQECSRLIYDIVAPPKKKSSLIHRITAIYKWLCYLKQKNIKEAKIGLGHVHDSYGDWKTLLSFDQRAGFSHWRESLIDCTYSIPLDNLIDILPIGISRALERENNGKDRK